MTAGDGLDETRCAAHLRAAIPGLAGEMRAERISGGQSNPSFFLTFDNARLVLRKQPPGELLPSAHAIDREFRVMRALAATAVPVPAMVLYCDDRTVIGTPFYVMQRVEGRVFHGCDLAGAPRDARRAMYRSLAETLAVLHGVDPDAVGLADYGRPHDYFARQIARWTRQWQLSRLRDDRNIDRLLDWLPRHVPEDDRTGIVHGDYRIGNVIFAPRGPEVAAVLDWELSTLGHPLADLAHCCIAWHTTPAVYGGIDGLGLADEGLPTQAEFEDWYYARAGHGLRLAPFHMAFALFRFAVIFEGIAARAKAGNASDARAARHAHVSAALAERAAALLP